MTDKIPTFADMAEPYVDIHTHRPTGRHIELRTAGIHPWMADAQDAASLLPLPEGVQAIGEIGLDLLRGPSPERQTETFRQQLAIAEREELPVVLHCVRAFEPVMQLLAGYRLPAVIFHGFIGSPEQAARAADRRRSGPDRRHLRRGRLRTAYGSRGAPRNDTEQLQPHLRIEMTMTDNWLERTELLLGPEKLATLRRAHVLVVGLGGVGAYAAEMIARAGVGRMTVADADTVSLSNINRQLVALHSTVGLPKAEVLAARLRDINPAIELTTVEKYIRDEETYALLDAARYDYVVDAIDTLSPKLALIAATLERGMPLVSAMGAGAKTDPTRMEIADISKTHHCPLAHMLRKRLHKIGIRSGFRAVFSPEPIREGAIILCEEQNKKSNVGTISYLPALFGIGCASVAIRGLLGELDD